MPFSWVSWYLDAKALAASYQLPRKGGNNSGISIAGSAGRLNTWHPTGPPLPFLGVHRLHPRGRLHGRQEKPGVLWPVPGVWPPLQMGRAGSPHREVRPPICTSTSLEPQHPLPGSLRGDSGRARGKQGADAWRWGER